MDHIVETTGRVALLLGGMLLAACSGPGAVGGDAGLGADATLDISGVELGFSLMPGVGMEVAQQGATITLEKFELKLLDLRLIGDSATGDERTSKAVVELKWEDDDPLVETVGYPEAPPGRYSLVRAGVSVMKIRAEIEPSEGEEYELKVDYEGDTNSIDFALAYDLHPGEPLLTEVVLDMSHLFEAIDLDALEVVDGVVTIDKDSAEVALVLAALGDGITAIESPN